MNAASFRRGRRAFTLVEIMIVVLVVGVLSTLAVAAMSWIKERTAHTLVMNNLRQLYFAKEFYFGATGKYGIANCVELRNASYISETQYGRYYRPNDGGLETKMGWVYAMRFAPGLPVAAAIIDSTTGLPFPDKFKIYPGSSGLPGNHPSGLNASNLFQLITGGSTTAAGGTTSGPTPTGTVDGTTTGNTGTTTTAGTTGTTSTPGATGTTTTAGATGTTTTPGTTGTTTTPGTTAPTGQTGPGNSDFGHSHGKASGKN